MVEITNSQNNASKTYVLLKRVPGRVDRLLSHLRAKLDPTPNPKRESVVGLYQIYAEHEKYTRRLSQIIQEPNEELVAQLEEDIERNIEKILEGILAEVGTLRGEERTIYENSYYYSAQDIFARIDREGGESNVEAILVFTGFPVDPDKADFSLTISYIRLDETAVASFIMPKTHYVQQTLIPKIRDSIEEEALSD